MKPWMCISTEAIAVLKGPTGNLTSLSCSHADAPELLFGAEAAPHQPNHKPLLFSSAINKEHLCRWHLWKWMNCDTGIKEMEWKGDNCKVMEVWKYYCQRFLDFFIYFWERERYAHFLISSISIYIFKAHHHLYFQQGSFIRYYF